MDRRRGRDDAQAALPFDVPPHDDSEWPPPREASYRQAPHKPTPGPPPPAVQPRPRRPGEKDRPLTVEALVRAASLLVEENLGLVWVEGEVSNLRAPGSGHVYFLLKDGGAQLPSVMFRSNAQRLRFRFEEGQKLLVRGRLGIYPEQGKLQLYAESAEPSGLGAAALALEQLKKKLAAEGLFDPARKRPLPRLPRRIGVVTSATGAAVRDIIRVIERRFPVPILISHARVQGDNAGGEIAWAIRRLCAFAQVDVIIVGRGGGSQEELGAFNDERVVRAIAGCHVPVISAVGHEIDTTLADLAADVRAATPTAAGEMCVPERTMLAQLLAKLEARLGREARFLLNNAARDLERLEGRLVDPRRRLAQDRQRLDELVARAEAAVREKLSDERRALAALEVRRAAAHPRLKLAEHKNRLESLSARLAAAVDDQLVRRQRGLEAVVGRLNALSPLRVLERGYAVARTPDGRVITDESQAQPGDRLDLILRQGQLVVKVEPR